MDQPPGDGKRERKGPGLCMSLCLAEPSLHSPPTHFPLWASKPPLFSLQRGSLIICRAQAEAPCLPNTHTHSPSRLATSYCQIHAPPFPWCPVGGRALVHNTTHSTVLPGVNSKRQVPPFPFPCHCEVLLCSAVLPCSTPEGQSQVNLPWLANSKMQLELFLVNGQDTERQNQRKQPTHTIITKGSPKEQQKKAAL